MSWVVNVRGIHGSGKSTVVRSLLRRVGGGKPQYGLLGPRMPEAYRCTEDYGPLYILGPYESEATSGGDYITKKGVKATVDLLQKYSRLGPCVFESVLVSTRFLEPSVGEWMLQHQKDIIHVSLDTSYDLCLKSVLDRQKHSIAKAAKPKHIERQWIDFGNVTKRLTGLGFRMEVCSRMNAVDRILGWLEEPF